MALVHKSASRTRPIAACGLGLAGRTVKIKNPWAKVTCPKCLKQNHKKDDYNAANY